MKKVLVIDDTKANRIFMSKCLEIEGYDVTALGNGREGVELLKTETFNLIILDMKMPSMSGMEILKWIRENSVNAPVVVVTAYGTVKNAIECMNNDVVGYIQKPFTMNRFKKCICDIEKKIEDKYDFRFNNEDYIINKEMEFDSDTQYASSKRMADDIILNQAEQIIKDNRINNLFSIIPYSILILNNERQIIYSNNYFLQLLGVKSEKEIIGFRPGEILQCIHANEMISGCGTTQCCSVCGAVNAILESQKKKTAISKECLMTLEGEICIELLISAAPAEVINNDYTVLVVRDISEEKRKEAIEKVFFHDILNTLGSIRGLVDCIDQSLKLEDTSELINCISETTNIAIDEIKSQADLIAAEKGDLELNLSRFSLRQLIKDLIKYYHNGNASEIKLQCEEDFIIKSDKVLVLRVVNNMLKNAVEASKNKVINIGIENKEGFVEIYVHNKKWIPEEVQLQIFKRSFSTKGKGRGLGTYSMKLIGEEYLKGYIRFISEKENGTKFILGLPCEADFVLLK